MQSKKQGHKKKKTKQSHSRSSGSRPSHRLLEALNLYDEKRWEEARALLEQLHQRNPRDIEVLELLGDVANQQRDSLEVVNVCQRLRKLEPRKARVSLQLGAAYTNNGQVALAVKEFNRFLEQWPDHPEGQKVKANLGSIENALQVMLAEHGLTGPDSLELAQMHETIQLHLEQGEFTLVRSCADKMISRFPTYMPALNNLAEAYFGDGDIEKAIATSKRVLETEPNNFHALANLTRYFCASGNRNEAVAVAEQLVPLESTFADIWVKKAEAFSILGNDAAVMDAWERAQASGLSNTGFRRALLDHLAAVVFCRRGEERQARRLWKQALRHCPTLVLAQENLVDLQLPLGERNGPWAFPFTHFLCKSTAATLKRLLSHAGSKGNKAGLEREGQEYVEKNPWLGELVSTQFERGDPAGRTFAFTFAKFIDSPQMRERIRDFALSQHGPDRLRFEAASYAREVNVLPPGRHRMWQKGEWLELELLGIEVHGEPSTDHPPHIQEIAQEGYYKLREMNGIAAEALFQRALKEFPDAPDLLHNLAMSYITQGREQEGFDLVRDVHRRFPDYVFARTIIARLHIKAGDLDQAQDLLKPLLTLPRLHFSEFAAISSAQIELHLARGMEDSARSLYESWATIDPEHPELERFHSRFRNKGWLKRLMGSWK